MASDRVRPAASRVRRALSASSSSLTDIARATRALYHDLYDSGCRTTAHAICGWKWTPSRLDSLSGPTANLASVCFDDGISHELLGRLLRRQPFASWAWAPATTLAVVAAMPIGVWSRFETSDSPVDLTDHICGS